MSRVIALLALALATAARAQTPVCTLSFCDCHPAAHPSWTVINCTLPHNQQLDLMDGDLPDTTTDFIVTGAEAVMFGMNSLSRLKDARQIRITESRLLVLRKSTAVNMNVVSVYLDIEGCDVLRIERGSFENIKGPLSVSISNCEAVSIEGEAFSWLLNMNITNVGKLELGPGSFMLDPTAANVGQHGPGMTIDMKNVTVPEFPDKIFGSSAARIYMELVEVHAVRGGAFSANTYNTVMAINCSLHLLESDAFAPKTLINTLLFYGCRIQQLESKALRSAVGTLNISHSRFENILTGAFQPATVPSVTISNSVFKKIMEGGFQFSSWNKFRMSKNTFDELPPYAIIAPGASVRQLLFVENEIETLNPNSLAFIGHVESKSADRIIYKDNYYGKPCYCNITYWIAEALATTSTVRYEEESYCTVDEFFARCFNVPEQNMQVKKFLDSVCTDSLTVHCETYKSKMQGDDVEIKNPRFPHKDKEDEGLTDRNKKVIGIVIVTCLGCVIIAIFISFIKWLRRRGHCVNVKNILMSSNSSCGSFCDRLCSCGMSNGVDTAGSISQLSVQEYSERRRLNEPRSQEIVQETTLLEQPPLSVIDKMTQTLPEELTKELLENLKERLENPENYVEARETIEHLYELTKMEERCHHNTPTLVHIEENIYELPYQQTTTPQLGKNNIKMVSVGTRTPSIEKLMPLSPYNRKTALAHEYFEPKDMAIHLYAEIANNDKEKKNLIGAIPDLVAEQAMPRGPYLRAVHEKCNSSSTSSTPFSSPSSKSMGSTSSSLLNTSTIASTGSNASGKMINRPLPEKPTNLDPGEGTSTKHG